MCVRECVHVHESVNALVYMSTRSCVRVGNMSVPVCIGAYNMSL